MYAFVKSFDMGHAKSLSYDINVRLVIQAMVCLLIQFVLQFNRIPVVTGWRYLRLY
jgi:hypothetical protein